MPPAPSGERATLRGFVAWLGRLPRFALVAAAVLALIGLAAAAYAGYTAYDYTMNNPAFCRSCHIMEAAWTRWASSEHRAVDCHACHEQSITESARQVIVFAIRRPQRVGRHARVPAERCRTCHASGDPRWRQVAETAGHRVHAEQRHIECVVCHSQAVHRIRPVEDVCVRCHQAQTAGARAIKIAQMADFHCVDCHQFLRLDSPLRPTRLTCLGCHQALPPRKTVGFPPPVAHITLTCSTCHKPHERPQPVVGCSSCHAAARPALHRRPAHSATTCTTCHRPHAWRVEGRQACLGCHQDRTTHNAPLACASCHPFK